MEIYSTDYIRQVAYAAQGGSNDAIRELKRLNRKYAEIVNKRIKRAEKAGMLSSKQQKLLRWDAGTGTALQNRRLSSGSLGGDVNALARQLIGIGNYLRSGENLKTIRVESDAQFADLADRFNIGPFASKHADIFRKFMETDGWKELKKIDSDVAVRATMQMIQRGASLQDLQAAFDRWQRDNDLYLGDVWHDLGREYDVDA